MFWAAAYPSRKFPVSAELNVRYARKIEVGPGLPGWWRGWREQRRVSFTEAELRDASGRVCAKATGKFLPSPAGDVPLTAASTRPDGYALAERISDSRLSRSNLVGPRSPSPGPETTPGRPLPPQRGEAGAVRSHRAVAPPRPSEGEGPGAKATVVCGVGDG